MRHAGFVARYGPLRTLAAPVAAPSGARKQQRALRAGVQPRPRAQRAGRHASGPRSGCAPVACLSCVHRLSNSNQPSSHLRDSNCTAIGQPRAKRAADPRPGDLGSYVPRRPREGPLLRDGSPDAACGVPAVGSQARLEQHLAVRPSAPQLPQGMITVQMATGGSCGPVIVSRTSRAGPIKGALCGTGARMPLGTTDANASWMQACARPLCAWTKLPSQGH
jgi:hypothetical protein